MGMFNFVLDSLKGQIFYFKVDRRVLVASTVFQDVFRQSCPKYCQIFPKNLCNLRNKILEALKILWHLKMNRRWRRRWIFVQKSSKLWRSSKLHCITDVFYLEGGLCIMWRVCKRNTNIDEVCLLYWNPKSEYKDFWVVGSRILL